MEEDKAQIFLQWVMTKLEDRRVTENQLAKKAGIAHPMFYRLRSQGVIPSWENCYKLARSLDVSVYETFKMAGLIPTLSDFKHRERVDRIVEKMNNLPDDRVEFIFDMIDLVIKDLEKQKR
jgi:transcriptional regulator with XRE-family HTH domain